MNFSKVICILLSLSFISCNTAQSGSNQNVSPKSQLNSLDYVSSEYIYNTPEKKLKYEELKNSFLKAFSDSGNCYSMFVGNDEVVKDVNISTILHTQNYDTLLYAVTWHKVDSKRPKNASTTQAQLMIVRKDLDGRMKFDCSMDSDVTFFLSNSNESEFMSQSLKRQIIKAGYLKNNVPDPNFWSRIFSEKGVLNKE